MSETDPHDAFFAMARKCGELLLDSTGLFFIVEEHQVSIRRFGCKASDLYAAAEIVLLGQLIYLFFMRLELLLWTFVGKCKNIEKGGIIR